MPPYLLPDAPLYSRCQHLFSNDQLIAALGKFAREYKNFQVAKEDYQNHDGLQE
jgi:hypothetical protein